MWGFDQREIRGAVAFAVVMLLLVVGSLLVEVRRMDHTARHEEQTQHERLSEESVCLFLFDPNTISYDSLKLLGFTKMQAQHLLHYRTAGKIFRMAEDLDAIYGMSDSLFQRIRPYVRIGEAYRLRPHRDTAFQRREFAPRPRRVFQPRGLFRIDTVGVQFLRSMGFSVRWSEAFVDCYRRRGMRSLEELREIAFIGDSITSLLEPYLLFPERPADPYEQPVELNGADSATLRSLYGIGQKTVQTILEYRRRLGGFHRVEQLAEVKGVTEANYEKILQQIWCDSFRIQKIDINFAPASRLKEHPYLPPRTFRKLISKRQQRKSKGGWSTVEEMVDDNILTKEEAERLRPYLRFGTRQSQ